MNLTEEAYYKDLKLAQIKLAMYKDKLNNANSKKNRIYYSYKVKEIENHIHFITSKICKLIR